MTTPPSSYSGVIASVLVALIGILGLLTTYATAGATGAAYQVTDERLYVPFREQHCPNPSLPVPVFRQDISRLGEINSVFVGCRAEGASIPQERSTFRPERNRNQEATSMFSDHFTRRGSPRRIKGMLWADY